MGDTVLNQSPQGGKNDERKFWGRVCSIHESIGKSIPKTLSSLTFIIYGTDSRHFFLARKKV